MARFVDLTLPLRHGMRGVSFETACTLEHDGWNARTLHLYSHAGTHVDAPWHYGAGDQTVDLIPLQSCVATSHVADVRSVPPRGVISVPALGEVAGRIQRGEGLLLRTDSSKLAGTPEYRTAASYVRVRAGLSARPLLAPEELHMPERGGGLVVVGSYVPRSTQQLQHLLRHASVAYHELEAERLIDPEQAKVVCEGATAAARSVLSSGADLVLATSRSVLRGPDRASSLALSRAISRSICLIVKALSGGVRYILAKGGVTSSDIATEALGVRRAVVLGQIVPGVPVWQLGSESAAPGIPYIVFPGNVGGEDALSTVITQLHRP